MAVLHNMLIKAASIRYCQVLSIYTVVNRDTLRPSGKRRRHPEILMTQTSNHSYVINISYMDFNKCNFFSHSTLKLLCSSNAENAN